jgi:hypothetical protein
MLAHLVGVRAFSPMRGARPLRAAADQNRTDVVHMLPQPKEVRAVHAAGLTWHGLARLPGLDVCDRTDICLLGTVTAMLSYATTRQ